MASLQSGILEDIADIMIEKGVESIDDLSLVETIWLSKLNLNDIQLKKIVNKFKNQSEKGRETKALFLSFGCFDTHLNYN